MKLTDSNVETISRSPKKVKHLPKGVVQDPETQRTLIKKQPSVLQFINDNDLDETVVTEEIIERPEILPFIKRLSHGSKKKIVEKHPWLFPKFSKESTHELQELAIKQNPGNIINVSKHSKKLHRQAVTSDPHTLRFVQDQDDDIVEAAVELDPSSIIYAKHPSRKALLTAYKHSVENNDEQQTSRGKKMDTETINTDEYEDIDQLTDEQLEMLASSDPTNIALIKNPSSQMIMQAVRHNPSCVQFLERTEEVMMEAVKHDPEAIRFAGTEQTKVHKRAVSLNPSSIRHIDNPDESIVITAIELDPFSVSHIKNPSINAQRLAVTLDPDTVATIDSPDESAIDLAVELDPHTIRHFPDCSEETRKKAVSADPETIKYISHPSQEVQKTALFKHSKALDYIDKSDLKLDKETRQRLIKRHRNITDKLDDLTDAELEEAINVNPFAIKHVKNVSDKLQQKAIKLCPHVISHIDNPSKEAQMTAVDIDPNVVKTIKNVHPDVLEKWKKHQVKKLIKQGVLKKKG